MSDEQIRRASLRNLDLFQDLMQDWTTDNFALKQHDHIVTDIIDFPESMPASDVYDWAKQSEKPTYTAAEVGLENVGNYKAVSTEVDQGLTTTEQINARNNIGAGDGDYNHLANKPALSDASLKAVDDTIEDETSSNLPTTAAVVAYVQAHGGGGEGETYYEGTGIDIDATNHINAIYGATAGTACEGNDSRLSDARPASDVADWAKAATKPTYTLEELGLDKVGNYKSLSVESAQELTEQEKEIARNNIGAGTSNFSGSYDDLSGKPTLGTAASKNITNVYNSEGTDPVTGQAIASALATLPTPMVFKGSLGTGGTITTLPAASESNKGFNYKVITNGTYAGQSAKVGDQFISDGSNWVLIPSGDEPSGTVTSVGITQGTGITVSGGPVTTSGTITVSHKDTSSQASVSNSGRTYIQSVTLDSMGHVTGLTSATETVTDTTYPILTGTSFATTPGETTAKSVSAYELRKILKQILLGGNGSSDFTATELANIRNLLNNVSIQD